ncbi:hypothetical protein NQK81_02055 [Amycolatopsis roodepoortensis]|uniref:hypothetical protein n=1 Tax=Amycolatopsis roodepoortensis TaxID=700274 RepID=UPI00214A94A1|nr:hypothetical protein [Amycolatopsis roodepoortensis]UUV32258.1 hypothetical protein NQK81_02055 [Amycolatopsis roodepoortensis]
MTSDSTDTCLMVAIIHQDDVLQCTLTPPFQEPEWQLPSVPHVPESSIEHAATWLLSDWGFPRTPLHRLGATSQTAHGVVQAGTLVMATVAHRTDLRMRAPDVRGVRWRHLRDSSPGSRSAVDRLLETLPLTSEEAPAAPTGAHTSLCASPEREG